jgi:hypothetical protein
MSLLLEERPRVVEEVDALRMDTIRTGTLAGFLDLRLGAQQSILGACPITVSSAVRSQPCANVLFGL